jgi:hypothetical protein
MESHYPSLHVHEYFGQQGLYVAEWFQHLQETGRKWTTLQEKQRADAGYKLHYSPVSI